VPAIHPRRPSARLIDRPLEAVLGNVGQKAALAKRPRLLTIEPASARVGQKEALLGARHGDVGEAPLLFQRRLILAVAQRRKHAVLEPGHEHHRKLEPLGRVHRHQGDALLRGVRRRHQRHLLEIVVNRRRHAVARERLAFVVFDRSGELEQVLDALLRLVRAVGGEPLEILRALEDGVGERAQRARMAHELVAQVVHHVDEAGQLLARRRGELGVAVLRDGLHRLPHGRLLGAGAGHDALVGRLADAARGLVDDALERDLVGGVGEDAQVGEQIFDLGAIVEADAADDGVRQSRRRAAPLPARATARACDKRRRNRRARGLVEAQPLNGSHHELRLRPLVLGGLIAHQLAAELLGEEALLLALQVARDDGVGGVEDDLRRAVVLLQLDGVRVGMVALEVEDVAHVGAAPAVDRLVVVADDAQVRRAPRQVVDQIVLDAVGVLELVDEHVIELVGQLRPDDGIAAQLERLEQQIAEVDAVGLLEPLLIDGIDARHQIAEVVVALQLVGTFAAVLGAVDGREHGARRGEAIGDAEIFEHARDERALVVVVEDGEVAAEADAIGVHAQEARAGGVERAHPHAAGRPAVSFSMRSRISPAALLVKVTARMRSGQVPRRKSSAMRKVMTRVLPEPAPARMSSGPRIVEDGVALRRVESF
jgi:nitrogen regulatory protein PII